jgi:hypothetical protein
MAIKSKTELKNDVALNKLTSQFMIDMIDSLGDVAPDADGNYALGGSLPSDITTAGGVIALANNTFIIPLSGASYICRNIYWTSSSTWKLTDTGTVQFTITEMSDDGTKVEYNGEGTGGSTVTISSYETLKTDKYGRFSGSRLHDNAQLPSGAVDGYIASGTFVPVAAALTNVSAATAYKCQWIRTGNIVNVFGMVQVTTIATGDSRISLTMPIESSFTDFREANGNAASNGQQSAFAIYSNLGDNKVIMQGFSASTSIKDFYYTYAYEIL